VNINQKTQLVPIPVITKALFIVLLFGLQTITYACIKREPTRDTGPGPHDFSSTNSDNQLWKKGDVGEPLILRARVLDTCSDPIVGAEVQILHANQDGIHEADRWRAGLKTDGRGEFKLLTVFPGYTGGIPRHMHFVVSHPKHQLLMTRLFFKNDPSIDHGIEDLAIVLEEIQRKTGKGWAAGYEFVMVPN